MTTSAVIGKDVKLVLTEQGGYKLISIQVGKVINPIVAIRPDNTVMYYGTIFPGMQHYIPQH